MTKQSFRDLVAWQRAIDLVTAIYELTRSFPAEEMYGLTSQLRRAAVSVASNIAEGQARFSRKEFKHFLRNARGSLAEVETQIVISNKLGYAAETRLRPVQSQIEEEGRRLNGLINSIQE